MQIFLAAFEPTAEDGMGIYRINEINQSPGISKNSRLILV